MNIRRWFSENFKSHAEPYAWWEMFCMRGALAWLVFQNFPSSLPYRAMTHPNGIGHWLDLTFLALPGVVGALRMAAILCLVAFTLGFCSVPVLGYLFVVEVLIGTLLNSHGAIGHYSQLLTMVPGALWAGASVDRFRGWNKKRTFALWDSLARQRTMIHWARVLIAGAYLTSAITKLEVSRGRWFWDAPNISVQIIKTQNTIAATSGAPVDPFYAERLPHLIVEHPNLSRLFFSPGLWLEFVVFLGLIGRGWSAVIGVAVILLHELISRLMGLNFTEHEAIMAIFYVNFPFWLVCASGSVAAAVHARTSGKTNQETAYFFYDADCGICTRCVDWLGQKIRAGGAQVELIAYQEPSARARFPQIDWSHSNDGVQFIPPSGRVRRDAEAVAGVLKAAPRWSWLGHLLGLPGVATLAQFGYRLVAVNRLRISRACGLGVCTIRPRDAEQ